MTNHVRTLLLNTAGPAPGDQYPGSEYIPASFQPINLTYDLASLRNVLFEPNADSALLNLRLAQIMTCIHATELNQYSQNLDPRITYYPPRSNRLWRTNIFGAI